MNIFNDRYSSLFETKGGREANNASYQINKAFTWIALIDRLSNGDITKHELVRDININYVFFYLSYLKDSDRVEENKRRDREIKNNRR